MTIEATREQLGDTSNTSPVRYQPSWVDLLVALVRPLPVPGWLFYLSLWVAVALLLSVGMAVTATTGASGIGEGIAFWSLAVVYYLALMHYLDGLGERALQAFRPASSMSEATYHGLHHELTTMPARETLVAGLAGAGLTVMSLLLPDGPAYSPLVIHRLPGPVGMVVVVLANVVMATFIYHSIRQLRVVGRIHATIAQVNLFQRGPLYAFSKLTARTGIGYLLALSLGIIPRTGSTRTDWLFDVSTLLVQLLAIATFILPLLAVQRCLAQEKQHREDALAVRLEHAFAELHARIDSGTLQDVSAVRTALDALGLERDTLAKVSIWPWQFGTLAGFGSALLLPLTIWLIQQLLGPVLATLR
jgi:hypothetical protein